MLNEQVETDIPKFAAGSEDLMRFAARFLLLIGEEQKDSEMYDEIIDFIFKYAPPEKVLDDLFSAPAAAVTEAKDIKDMDPALLSKLNDLLGNDVRARGIVVSDLEKELAKARPDLSKVLQILSKNKGTGPSTRPSAGTPATRNAGYGTKDQYFDKIYNTIEKYGPNVQDYFNELKSKFFNYVRSKYSDAGKRAFIDANARLSDKFPGKQSMEKFADAQRRGELSDQQILDMLSRDEYYAKPARIGQIAQDIGNEAIAKFNALSGTVSESVEIIFDLNEAKRIAPLNESFMAMFRTWVKVILQTVFGDLNIPVKVQGNPSEVEAFARAISNEQSYIQSIKRYGLDNRQTYQSRANLASSIRNFESETGLKWPFK